MGHMTHWPFPQSKNSRRSKPLMTPKMIILPASSSQALMVFTKTTIRWWKICPRYQWGVPARHGASPKMAFWFFSWEIPIDRNGWWLGKKTPFMETPIWVQDQVRSTSIGLLAVNREGGINQWAEKSMDGFCWENRNRKPSIFPLNMGGFRFSYCPLNRSIDCN